ncbi:MAG: hypothetical protein NXH85_16815 [Pseudomonadaceae bacterium]|nr:hypothetical protein [Pseudomonadaceae bacterium]
MSFTEQLTDAQLALAHGLGIDVYRLRHGRRIEQVSVDASAQASSQGRSSPPATTPATKRASAPATSASAPASGGRIAGARGEIAAMRAALGVDASQPSPPDQRVQTPANEPQKPADTPADSEEVVRCELVAWRSGATFLVCARSMLNDDSQRLIQDLLRALDPDARTSAMEFSWPAGGGGPSDAQSATKAWRAFWQRRSEGATLLLATSDALLDQWLADEADVQWLPALDTLVGNGVGKRQLWRALCDARRADG